MLGNYDDKYAIVDYITCTNPPCRPDGSREIELLGPEAYFEKLWYSYAHKYGIEPWQEPVIYGGINRNSLINWPGCFEKEFVIDSNGEV